MHQVAYHEGVMITVKLTTDHGQCRESDLRPEFQGFLLKLGYLFLRVLGFFSYLL